MANGKSTNTTVSSGHKQVPFRAGLHSMPASPSEKPYLIAGKCKSCGEITFPLRSYCLKCTADTIEEVNAGNKGHLLAYTIIRQKPPRYQGPVPYALGIVELESGARATTGLVCDPESETPKIGMEMELVLEKAMEDEEGNDMMVFKFKPTGKG